MGLKLNQFRCRAAIRRPVDTGFNPATVGTTKSGKSHHDLTEKRRDHVLPMVFHSARAAAARADRPPGGMLPDLGGDDFLLERRQQLLRFRQGQTQSADVTETVGPTYFNDVPSLSLSLGTGLHQPQNPGHAPTLPNERCDNAFLTHTPQLCTAVPSSTM